ncbi:synaptic vesicle 2-related protein, partial [Nephila pilipes]
RSIVGIALGGVNQGLTLCTEYCPVNNRGKAGFYLCYFWSIGTCLVILLSWLVMEYLNSWRHLIAFLALPSLIVIISLKVSCLFLV